MSDIENQSDTSESTIEHLTFDKVLDGLKVALDDVLQTKDYLSYSTVLEIYLSNPENYTNDQREQLLQYLYDVLNENKELTYEIGWDLPSLIILYIDSDYDFTKTLREAPSIHKVMKIFETLAYHGNAKELFMKCNELLSTLKLSEPPEFEEEESINTKFFDVKLFCIFELIDSCLKKIKTYYPSRFLSMTITSFINLIHENAIHDASNTIFLTKRVYNFARNYTSPSLPDDYNEKYTKEELSKIKDDEEYLQRKLLTAFVTESLYLGGRNIIFGYSVDIFTFLQDIKSKQLKDKIDFRIQLPVIDRLYELSLSYDLEVDKIFKKFLVDSHTIFKSFDFNNTSEDDINGIIFEKIVIDYQENLNSVIIDSSKSEIRDSTLGCLLLYTHHISSNRDFNSIDLSFNDALVLTLRCLIPGLVNKKFLIKEMQDIMVYWSWFSIHKLGLNNRNIELEISSIPHILLKIYYQILLFVLISNPFSQNFRFVTLTLLTRVLTLSPQDVAFSFIKDSLHNCPYDNLKIALISVLKELLTKDKDKEKEKLEDVSKNLNELNIKEGRPLTRPSPPSLPSRENNVSSSTKYLTLTDARADDIFELIDASINDVFIINDDEDDVKQCNLQKFVGLSSYLNLLIVIKNDSIISRSKIDEIINKVDDSCKMLEAAIKNDESKNRELNSIGILKIALDRLKK